MTRRLFNVCLAILLAASGFILLPPAFPASGATLVVTSTADSGAGSLRQVIADAAPGDTITFSLTTPATITLSTPITVNKSLRITGPGSALLTISGGSSTQIFRITAGTVRISQMTLTHGRKAGSNANYQIPGTEAGLGGAVYIGSGAGMTATDVVFSDNAATGGNGGGPIFVEGTGPDAGFHGGAGGGVGGYTSADGGFAGGGGGGGASPGGDGGFAAGGGGSNTGPGGSGGTYGGDGGDGWGEFGFSAGGGGAALGGAVFIASGGAFGAQNVTFTGNSVQGGNGGSAGIPDWSFGGGGGGGGAGLGSAVFNGGSYCALSGVTFTGNTATGGAAGAGQSGFGGGPGPASPGQGYDTTPGLFDLTNDHSCAIWYYPPTDITFTPISLDENQPPGASAGTLSTADPDAGDTFTYSLVSGAGSTDNTSFAISGSGLVTAASLDYEAQSTYSVRIRTTDSHNYTYEKAFTLTINDANDPPTNILLSATTVAEDRPSGTTVGALTSTDPETSQSHTYSLVNPGGACSGADNPSFTISGNSLVTAASFNFETKNAYTVCIRSTDNGSPSQTLDKQFTISVTNVNEAPTGIGLSLSSIAENEASGTTVGSLSTTDPDTGQSFTYSLVNPGGACSGTDNGSFGISGSSLVTAASFDFEAKNSYALCVRATDNGSPSQTLDQPFTITITDVNEIPADIALSATTVAENQPSGTAVGALSTTDVDAGQSFTYALVDVSGCSGPDNSLFTIGGANLVTAASFDYENASTYTICVRTTDDGVPALSYTEQFTVAVSDINEAPTHISLTPAAVLENQPPGTMVGALTTSDPDTGQSYTYSLVDPGGACSGTDNGLFAVDGETLETAASFDYESKNAYTICIRTTDNGTPSQSFEEQLTVSIIDGNEAPTEIGLSPSAVAENQLPGTTVGTLSTVDPDDGQSFAYSLVNPGGACSGVDNASFAISGDTLTTAASFNFEAKATYIICIRSIDSGTPAQSLDRQFSVTVTDLNETPTAIALSSASIDENQPGGTTIGALTTTDPDDGQSFSYTLVDPGGACSGADNTSFAISGSSLVAATSFDFETRSSYTVCVRSADSGSPSLSIDNQFTIMIGDANEAPTGISLSAGSIAENQPSGTEIGRLTTTDVDAGQAYLYSLVNPGGACSGVDNAFFAVSGDKLVTAASFDFETESSYTICLRTTDNGTPNLSFDMQINIGIMDANDPPTAMTLSATTVAENQPSGTAVGALSTTDVDPGQSFTYALVDVSGCSGPDIALFEINGDILVTAGSFDFENRGSYTLCVRSTDDGIPHQNLDQQVTVTITDVNEAPTGIGLSSSSVAENLPAGTTVGVFSTADVDAGQSFGYALVDPGGACSGMDNGSFAIGGDTLMTAVAFDYEGTNTYTICVRSTDDGSPSLSVDQQLTIAIANANDRPVFESPDTATFSIGTPGAFTFVIVADPRAALVINAPAFPAGLSFIDNLDGTVTMSGVPAAGSEGTYPLTLTATNVAGSAEQDFTLIVNEAPAITSPNRVTFATGVKSAFTISSHAAPLAAITLAGVLPSGVTFRDNGDGTATLGGIPAPGAAGDYPLVIRAENGVGNADQQDFTLLVENPPVVTKVNSLPDTGDGEIVENESTHVAIQKLMVVFTNPMDAALASDVANYRLAAESGSAVEITSALYDPAARTATLGLNAGQTLAAGAYTLIARSVLADADGFTLASDFVRHFTIDFDGPQILGKDLLAIPGNINLIDGRSYSIHFTSLSIRFDSDLYNPAGDGDTDDVTNPANYLLVQPGPDGQFDTVSCRSGLAPDDARIPTGPVIYTDNQDKGPFVAEVTLNGGTPLPSGEYLLLVCGSTSLVDPAGNPLNNGSDARVRFTIFDPGGAHLPETGFAPGILTPLPDRPASQVSTDLGDLWIEIPTLHVQAPVAGISIREDSWDLTWLSDQAGWLAGTAFPTWNGNSVITAHVYNADGTPGLFVNLKSLAYDQDILLHAFGLRYTYAVRANRGLSASDSAWVFQHQDRPWLTLLTCEGYDAAANTYTLRRAVRAVLVAVEAER